MLIAVAPPRSSAAALLAPPGFRLKASDGYRVAGIGFNDPEGTHDELLLIVARRHSSVIYVTPAEVTESSIEADLGAVGRIDVNFAPSGGSHRERSPCGKESVDVQSGYYEGSIDLRGEEGYMHARASRAPGEVRTMLGLLCPGGVGSEGTGGHSPGARLTIRRHSSRMAVQLTARKNSPTRVSRFEASIQERRGQMAIFRGVDITAAPAAFVFDVPTGAARISPPSPFSGGALYDRERPSRLRLRADLAIDFPGRAGVKLNGPGATAGLVRAVENPSHPFRPPRLARGLRSGAR